MGVAERKTNIVKISEKINYLIYELFS